MWRRTPTIDLLATEFALAVAEGDHARAEGWLATAMAVRDREDRATVRSAGGQYAPRWRNRTGTVFARMYRS